MKLLFTADIHIKLGQKNVPIPWAINRYHILASEICRVFEEEKCSILLIGGDIFDRLPTMEELEVYFDFMECLPQGVPTRIIPGNHEALKKNTTFLSSLKRITTIQNTFVDIIDDYHTEFGIDFLPYNKLKEYHPADVDFHSKILVTHVRGEIPPHVKPEVNLEIFDRWDIVLAGDLHSHDNCQRNIVYPGSPITTSFHRSVVSTGVVVLDMDTLAYTWHELQVPQLVRKTISANEPMPATDYHHTIYEVEGDLLSLKNVENNQLLDKKIVKRNVDTALILDNNMSVSDELREYLAYILELKDADIDKVLQEYMLHEPRIK